jgi:hypothetical protein
LGVAHLDLVVLALLYSCLAVVVVLKGGEGRQRAEERSSKEEWRERTVTCRTRERRTEN